MTVRILRRRAVSASKAEVMVEFCDSCAQVCTPDCRSQSRIDRDRASVVLAGYPLIR